MTSVTRRVSVTVAYTIMAVSLAENTSLVHDRGTIKMFQTRSNNVAPLVECPVATCPEGVILCAGGCVCPASEGVIAYATSSPNIMSPVVIMLLDVRLGIFYPVRIKGPPPIIGSGAAIACLSKETLVLWHGGGLSTDGIVNKRNFSLLSMTSWLWTETGCNNTRKMPATSSEMGIQQAGDNDYSSARRGPKPRAYASLTSLEKNRGAVLFGGHDGTKAYNQLDILSPDTVWSLKIQPNGKAPGPRYGHAAVAKDSNVIFHGGCSSDFEESTPIKSLLKDIFILHTDGPVHAWRWSQALLQNHISMQYVHLSRVNHHILALGSSIVVYGGHSDDTNRAHADLASAVVCCISSFPPPIQRLSC